MYLFIPQPEAKKRKEKKYTALWFDLVEFYGIPIIVGYSVPNPVHTYILDIYDM